MDGTAVIEPPASPSAASADQTAPTDKSADSPSVSPSGAVSGRSGWSHHPGLLSLLTGGLLYLSFFPFDQGWLAWLALVPLLRLATLDRVGSKPRHRYLWAMVAGLVWTVPQLQWMRLGDPMMYLGWAALAVYVAAYLPAFVGLVRLGVGPLRLPLPLVAGIGWTALEYIRAHLFTGFAWYLLGHSQHRFGSLVQIADFGGAYAISLLIAAFAGVAVTLLSNPASRRGAWIGAAIWTGLFAGAVGYGTMRLSHEPFEPGPRVALVQGNFPSSLKSDPEEFMASYSLHRELTGRAVKEQPDLIVWPETMLPYWLYEADESIPPARRGTLAPQVDPAAWNRRDVANALADLAAMSSADLLLGGTVLTLSNRGLSQFNAAIPVHQETGLGDWYAKVHRVPFGEFVPFTGWSEGLSNWVRSIGLPNITAGDRMDTIELAGINVLPIICFEDTVPHLVRRAVKDAGTVDVLANLTNDGWFHGSEELDQHLVTAQFRSIECRVPTVRAVNTGISAIIDGDGRVRQPETLIDHDGDRTGMMDERGRYHRQFSGVLVSAIPLDPRGSVYILLGDWLAGGCLLLVVVGVVTVIRQRRRDRATGLA